MSEQPGDIERQVFDDTSSIGAEQINDFMHKSNEVEVKGTDRPLDHVKTRDMQDVAVHGDLPGMYTWQNHADGHRIVLRENKGMAAVDNQNPVFVYKGWEFYKTWFPNQGSGGFEEALAIRHQRSPRMPGKESAVFLISYLPILAEASPRSKRMLEQFINHALFHSGVDWQDPGAERMKLYNALMAMPDALMKAFNSEGYGQINNTTFVPQNAAMEALRVHDT